MYSIEKNDKIGALQTLLDQREGAPIIVFGKTKHGVKKLAKQLDGAGLSGRRAPGKPQSERA